MGMHNIPHVPFYFVRHGLTDWNLTHRAMGQQDVPLNEIGIAQAHTSSKALHLHPIQRICTSPLTRAKTTAKIIQKKVNAELVEVEDLKECCWGIHEGNVQGDKDIIQLWMQGEEIQNAEKYTLFIQRIFSGLKKSLKHPSPVLIVSHSGVFKILVQELTGQKFPQHLLHSTPLYFTPPSSPGRKWNVAYLEEALGNDVRKAF